ncbi:hypothetical protein ACNHUS_35380 [Actinomycetes bacterium M1A6_2h]
MTADDDAPPPIPDGPPWPADFVAALHAGCYDDESAVDPQRDPMVELWARVRDDPEASRMLDDLDEVRAVLGRLGDRN